MKQMSKLAIMLVLLVAGVVGVAAQNPFDVNTTVTNVKTVGTGDVGLVFKYGNLHYKIRSEKTVEVTGEVRSVCKGRVEIPNIVKHNNKTYTVVGIGNSAFSNQSEMTSVVIPTTVQYIESKAFASTGLTDVIIPGNNVTVKKQAFLNCKKLGVVTLSGQKNDGTSKKFGNTSAVIRII